MVTYRVSATQVRKELVNLQSDYGDLGLSIAFTSERMISNWAAW